MSDILGTSERTGDFASQLKDMGEWALKAEETNLRRLAPDLHETVGGHERLKASVVEDLLVLCTYTT